MFINNALELDLVINYEMEDVYILEKEMKENVKKEKEQNLHIHSFCDIQKRTRNSTLRVSICDCRIGRKQNISCCV